MPLISTIKTGCITTSTAGNGQRKLARTSDGTLHAVYHRSDGSYYQIYHAYSENNGVNWTEEALTSESYNQRYPSIAVDSNDCLHVVWQGTSSESPNYSQIRYRKYDGSWESITNLSSGDYHQERPVIMVDSGNNLHIVWVGNHAGSPNYYQIRYIKYTTSWGSIENLTSGDYHQYEPSMAIDSNDYLHVVWDGYHSGSPDYNQIRYRKYTSSWGSIENLTSGDYDQLEPYIALDGNDYLHIVWYGYHSGSQSYYQIRYRKYTDSWQTIETLTSGDYYQMCPSIAVDGDNYLYLVWHGKHADSPNYYQIRQIKYDGSWGNVENLTSAGTHQRCPNLIWAMHPDKRSKTGTGYAFIWVDGTTVKYYASADLTWIKVVLAQGVLSPSGAISKLISKNTEGSLSFAGITRQFVFKSLSGALSSAGALSKMVQKGVSGTLSFAGEISKLPRKIMEGAITPAGDLTRNIYKNVAGALGPSGVVTTIRTIPVALSGGLSFAGAVATEIITTITQAVGGVLSFEGNVSLIKSYVVNLAGSLSFAGELVKQISKNLAGGLTPTGALEKIHTIFVAIGGTLSFAGSLIKGTGKNLVGVIKPSGLTTKFTRKLVKGTLTSSGAVMKTTSKIMSGALSFIGVIVRPGRELLMRLFNRPHRDMSVTVRPYRDMKTETKDE